MTHIQLIPLAQLRLSPRNVRKTGGTDVDDLAASIAAERVLNNLVVTDAGDGTYEVEDGGRRLLALQQLQRDGRLTDQLASVPCPVVATDRGTEAGLTANLLRQAMHPADEFLAFQQLVTEGKAVEEIAERFGKTVRHIQQRLRLANVRPDLFELYREGGMNIDQLTALAVTDNHELQRQAWETARGNHERTPTHLREFITRESLRGDTPLPRFVGLEAYENAGGRVRSDLFSEDVYLLDRALLDSLALDKLESIAQQLREDGWAWAEARISMGHKEREAYGMHRRAYSAKGEERCATAADEARLAAIDARLDEIDEIDSDEIDREQQRALWDEQERLQEERDEIDERMLPTYPADVKSESGVLVYLSDGGGLRYSWARLPPASADLAHTTSLAGDAAASTAAAATKPAKKPELSEALRTVLSAHRSAAAAAQLAKDPTLAHCVLLERLLISHWPDARVENGLHLSFGRNANHLVDTAGGADIHKALKAVLADRTAIIKQVPRKGTLEFLLKQTDAWRLELQAALVAAHFDGITGNEKGHAGVDIIHRITGFDMAEHWTPETDGFLGRLHGDLVVAAVAEARGKTEAATLNGLKKAERAAQAGKLLAGTGWLPEPLRGADYGKKAAADAAKAAKPRKAAKRKPTKQPARKAAAKKAPAKKVAKAPAKKATKKAVRS